ncbi:hypothetical protein [Nocardiopsis deserti]|uniref:hypothetical protein n=1 Tax=Nocardiopsis deserti TaxID=2605988 RepID=UPI001CC22431|nr:hypothetical protein [Nocardiopsis deserti]
MVRGSLLFLSGVMLLAGCTAEADDATEPVVQSATIPSETEASEKSPEEEAVDTYLRFWDAIVLASAEKDPNHPDLEQYAVGQALELAQRGVQGVAEAGYGMEGEPVPAPEVVSAEPTDEPRSIVIRDCQGAGDWKVVGEAEPRSDNVRVDARVNRDVFSWRVVQLQVWGDDSC